MKKNLDFWIVGLVALVVGFFILQRAVEKEDKAEIRGLINSFKQSQETVLNKIESTINAVTTLAPGYLPPNPDPEFNFTVDLDNSLGKLNKEEFRDFMLTMIFVQMQGDKWDGKKIFSVLNKMGMDKIIKKEYLLKPGEPAPQMNPGDTFKVVTPPPAPVQEAPKVEEKPAEAVVPATN